MKIPAFVSYSRGLKVRSLIAAAVLCFAADALSVSGETIVVDAGATVLGPRFRKPV